MTETSEIKIAKLQTQMENTQDAVEKLDRKMDTGFLRIEQVIKDEVKGKANKWVETIAKMVLGIIIGSFVAGLIYIVWHVTPINTF